MRVLGRIRLSRTSEESTSALRQREIIEQWSSANGHTVIGWAEDLDVSGSVDPFEAPALREWWDREHEWDILCAWKLDRIGRRVIPLNKVFGWLLDRDKTLVCVSDNIDLSTWVGRLVTNVIAGVAEGELEAIRERTKASRAKLLESGRWPGGPVPFGFQPEPLPGGGWRLALHPEDSVKLREIVMEVAGGAAVNVVSRKHNLSQTTVWQFCENKLLLGHATSEGRTVRDSQGKPVLVADPLLTQDEWDVLQAALAARRQGPRQAKNLGPMNGVAKCYICEQNLLHKLYKRSYGKRVYRYYICRETGHTAQVDADTVEGILEKAFLDALGDRPVTEQVYLPAEDHQADLTEAVRAVDELTPLLGSVSSNTMRQRLTEQLSALDARIAELEKLPTSSARYELRETGSTFGAVWLNSDPSERRQLLLRSGIRFLIRREPGTQVLQYTLLEPEDTLERMNAKKPPAEAGG